MKRIILCFVLFLCVGTVSARENHGIKSALIFDLPIEYNPYVQRWIDYFQGSGRKHFVKWLEKHKSVAIRIQNILAKEGLPKDLVYMSMIESGFSPYATSHRAAVGPWQFIAPTAQRFGLKINSWIDERRDIYKSTIAATKYIKYLYQMFGSWYLVAAAYNTGENRVHSAIKKHRTKNFWELVRKKALHKETTNYVPKLIAATLISKAPGLYGFRKIKYKDPTLFEYFTFPGGTNIRQLSRHLNVRSEVISSLNPELKLHTIPKTVRAHQIKIPLSLSLNARKYLKR